MTESTPVAAPRRAALAPAAPTHLSADIVARARELIALYPEPRSALIPLCHLAQEQDGWLTPEAMVDIAGLVGVTPGEVLGTASFYDMLHTESVGKYVVAVCTNIACLLGGAAELLEHAEDSLGVGAGGTTGDGTVTLEEAECLADCDRAPCVQVNHRYVGAQTPESFDQLIDELRSGARDADIPAHGTLIRVRRTTGIEADPAAVVEERRAAADARAAREAASDGGGA
jgi:NADH-quinone oxidoreductase E subunit